MEQLDRFLTAINDTVDCGILVSAPLPYARQPGGDTSILDDGGAVTDGYDLMDAAYCSCVLREHSRDPGHVLPIDHTRAWREDRIYVSDAQRYKERSQDEGIRLKVEKCGKFESYANRGAQPLGAPLGLFSN